MLKGVSLTWMTANDLQTPEAQGVMTVWQSGSVAVYPQPTLCSETPFANERQGYLPNGNKDSVLVRPLVAQH